MIVGKSFPLFLFLLVLAVYGARKAYQQKYQLKLSDSGRVEVFTNGELISGVVSASSFYNTFFLSLRLQNNPHEFSRLSHNKKVSVVIYRDAVSEFEYRLLARLINVGLD